MTPCDLGLTVQFEWFAKRFYLCVSLTYSCNNRLRFLLLVDVLVLVLTAI